MTIKVGDFVSWGRKWHGAAGRYVPAHLGEVKSFEDTNKVEVPTSDGAKYAIVEVRLEHKKTGKFLGTSQFRPYVSQLTVTAKSSQSTGN